MRILVVRAAEDARRTAARLAAAGHAAIVAPVLVVRHIDQAIPGDFDAVVATSSHAFGVPDRLAALRTVPLYVVGVRTADVAKQAGFRSPLITAPNAENLARDMARNLPAGARVLYLAGRDRKPDLEIALGQTCALTIFETYAMEPAPELAQAAAEALKAGAVDATLHYSQRSAAIFLDLARRAGVADRLAGPRHIAISDDAAKPLVAAGLQVAVAAQPNEDSMIEQIEGRG
ncbi:MAG: uroporphyrinogen-III synthase [Rhodoblastus sp.]|nr:uroporphyrinogen-III synthase [Rhodoblastus sp.]